MDLSAWGRPEELEARGGGWMEQKDGYSRPDRARGKHRPGVVLTSAKGEGSEVDPVFGSRVLSFSGGLGF